MLFMCGLLHILDMQDVNAAASPFLSNSDNKKQWVSKFQSLSVWVPVAPS